MKVAFLTGVLVIVFQNLSVAQELRTDKLKPGRTLQVQQPKFYADSAEFVKEFNELYPKIKPALSVHETAEQNFKAISRSFKMQGIDSAEAAKAAFKNLDDQAFYKIYFDIFRRNLSAKDLKKYIEFIKTPEGAHIVEVIPGLLRALPESNMYVARTINVNMTPIRQAAREKAEKEQPPKKPLKPRPLPADGFQTQNPARTDSLMRMQHNMSKIPAVNIPTDTSGGTGR